MILKLGFLPGDSPQRGRAARPATLGVATGYFAIGTGAIMLSGALTGLFLAIGLAVLSLGLGFSQAVATLRAVFAPAPAQTAA